MKIKLDENLDVRLVEEMSPVGGLRIVEDRRVRVYRPDREDSRKGLLHR